LLLPAVIPAQAGFRSRYALDERIDGICVLCAAGMTIDNDRASAFRHGHQ
jgi:hypothetical protein